MPIAAVLVPPVPHAPHTCIHAHHQQMDDPWREAIAKCILRAMVVLEERMGDGSDKELLVKGGRDLLRVFGAMLGFLEEYK